jgi:tetratricopeptide (TPR) repeat protein
MAVAGMGRRIGNMVVTAMLLAVLAMPPSAGAQTQPAGAQTQPAGAQPQPAGAAAIVRVRAGDHPTHSRLVFDWPGDVNYTIERDGAGVAIKFDRPGSVDISQVPRARLRNVQNIAQAPAGGGVAVTFQAPADGDVRAFRNERSIVVDVLNAGTRKDAPKDPAPKEPAAKEPAAKEPPPKEPALKEPAPKEPPAAGKAVAAPSPAAPSPAAPAVAAPPGTTTTGVRGAPPAPAPAAPAASVPAPAPAPAQAAPPQAGARPGDEAGTMLVFDAGRPASMAVFSRAGYLYTVFDKPLPIGAGNIVGPRAELAGAIEPVPATGGSAFRTRIGPFLWPQVERQGTVWRIVATPRLSGRTGRALTVDADPDFLLGSRIVVRTADGGSVVQMSDPEVGDRLQVVPLPNPGEGMPEPFRYPDAELLPTIQGIAVRPVSDSVSVRPVKQGVEVTAAGGLHISPSLDTGGRSAPPPEAAPAEPGGAPATAPAATPAQPPPGANRRLFDLKAWMRGDLEHFTATRQALMSEVAEVQETERPKTQLDLARFYFAHGFAQEALGMMDVLAAGQPDLDGWSEFRALRGAANFLAGEYDAAEADLTSPGLAGNPEAELWRAAAAAERMDWAGATPGFRKAFEALAQYPEPMFSRLSLLATETALNTDDLPAAKRLIERVVDRGGPESEERTDVAFLRGQLYHKLHDNDQAIEQLRQAFDSHDRFYHAKAGLELTNVELEEGKISPSAAVERLAGLTFAWRGDELEVLVRKRLGEVLVAGGKYAEGFNTMKETAAFVGDGPKAEEITRGMARTFADIFKDGGMRMPTLDALALYDQFRELTPVGTAGDEIVRQLGERLVDLDLLERAAGLFQHQVEFRLTGLDKARMGTRLASIRLLDNKPEQALKALELSNVPSMPADLVAERRIMQAKALAEMGRIDEALQLLIQDNSMPANMLRVDIAWKTQKWDQAALALGKVIGPPPAAGEPLGAGTSQLVLNRAVALALAADGTGLNQLRKEFGAAMSDSPDADTFRVLTRPEQASGLIDVNTIKSRVAEVDMFQNFLKGYRARTAPAAPAPATPAAAPGGK